jgi:imidazolonepropionase-like amidohydrolase
MNYLKNLFVLIVFTFSTANAQQTPAMNQSKTIAIVGGVAHIGDGTIIENSIIIFTDGKLTTVSSKSEYDNIIDTKDLILIEAKGKHIYPGFIAANTRLGLVEIDAVRASDDKDEIGEMIPNIRSLIAYNSESKVVESMRPNGVLIAQVSPQGGTISGTSSIVQLDAWNWEDAVLKVDDGIHLNWPNNFRRGRVWLGEDPTLKANINYGKDIKKIQQFFDDSKAYNLESSTIKNLSFEAMNGLYNGSQRLFIHVDDEKGIIDAVAFSNKNNLKNIVLVGVKESYKTIDLLKSKNISVLVSTTHRLPISAQSDYDMPYKLPKILYDAGINVGIHNGDSANFQTRNLPFYAGQVVGQGLDKENALKLITSNTAKILGIDDKVGTLSPGKDATLFISKGDALDMRTNQIEKAYISGREISLESHQTRLWKRYKNKYKSQ